uniref:Uncharacterized protein n=1 Tax=viral metagenome TaxID=1070528 RepID=A0A6H2A6R8_9ZZZZ
MDKLIDKLKIELDEFRKMQVDNIKIPIITGMPGTHNNNSNIEEIVINRITEINKREIQLFELILLRGCIEDALGAVREDTAIDYILQDRYLQEQGKKKTFWQIAAKRNFNCGGLKVEDNRFMNKILCMIKQKPG